MVFLLQRWLLYLWCVSCAFGSVRELEGWLDRAVSFHRGRFLNDVREVAPAQIQVSVEPAPPGYVDSPQWDFPAVSRLLTLLGTPPHRAPRRALRRALRSSALGAHTRRFIGAHDSWKLFPSLNQDHLNDIYYDSQPSEDEEEEPPTKYEGGWQPQYDDAIVVLRNPVEARLPSAQISVRLLREILEARAFAARQMPSTPRSTIPWIIMNKTSTPGSSNGSSSDAALADGAATEATPAASDAPADKVTSDAPAENATADDASANNVTENDAPVDSTNAPEDNAPTPNETPTEEADELRKGAAPPRGFVDVSKHANSRAQRGHPKGKLAKVVARARGKG